MSRIGEIEKDLAKAKQTVAELTTTVMEKRVEI